MKYKKAFYLASELLERSDKCTIYMDKGEDGQYVDFVFNVPFVTSPANLKVVMAQDFVQITLTGHGALISSLKFADVPDFKIGPEHQMKIDKAHSAGLKNLKIMNKMLKRELEVWPDEGSENS